MTRVITLWVLWTSLSYGQAIDQNIDRLENSMGSGDWAKAAELSRAVKEEVVDARNQALAKGGGELVDSILSWLPQDTETFLVAQEPFPLSGGKAATLYVTGLFAVAEKGKLLRRFENRTITLAAIGARKFGEGGRTDNVPRLGMISYEGCAVYQLSEALSGALLTRVPEEKLSGHPVWQSKASEGDGPDWETIYVTILGPRLLTACNSHDFLREVLSRKSAPHGTRALPANLQEWSLVDRSSPVWGISHYRDGGAAQADTEVADATGIAVNLGKTMIRARMISKTDPWRQFSEMPDFQQAAKTRKVDDGVWELSVPAEGQAGAMGVFVLMGMLGFVVAI